MSLGALLGACAPAPSPRPADPTDLPIPTTRTSPSPSTTPSLPVSFGPLSLVQNEDELVVLGTVANRSGRSVMDLKIEVLIEDSAGQVLGRATVPTFLVHLGPEETTPFLAHFAPFPGAATAVASVIAYEPASFQRVEIEVAVRAERRLETGQVAILGEVENPGLVHARLHGLALWATGRDGGPIGVAGLTLGPTLVAPGQSYPFMAIADLSFTGSDLKAYSDATSDHPPADHGLTISPAVELLADSQDNPFLLGSIRNDGRVARWVSWLVSLTHQTAPVALVGLAAPIPVQPGGSLAFSITQIPGLIPFLSESEIDLSELELQAVIDPGTARTAGELPRRLAIEVRGFESVGSSLLLRGVVTNDHQQVVASPHALATVRSTDGRLVTAGWQPVADELGPSASAEFVLSLPLPSGVALQDLEFDVAAYGISP